MNTMYEVMNKLYSAANGNMSAADLREVGGALTEIATGKACGMRDVIEGVACLVSHDGDGGASPVIAGNFQQPEDVSTLLVAISREFDVLAGMVAVGNEALWKATELEREAGKGADHGA